MLDINGTDIEINKGNSAVFTITMTGDDVPADGTDILFVVRKSPHYETDLICKHLTAESGVLTVRIDPEDMDLIPANTYYWNLIIQYDAGESPWTISKKALKFIILPEIGSGGA